MRNPNLMVKAYNYLKAQYKHAKNDFKQTTVSVFYDRIHTCTRCEYFNDAEYSCNECGCPITDKANMDSESCPKNKW